MGYFLPNFSCRRYLHFFQKHQLRRRRKSPLWFEDAVPPEETVGAEGAGQMETSAPWEAAEKRGGERGREKEEESEGF